MTPSDQDAIANLGCVFPGDCVIKGDHLQRDCHTPEMAEWLAKECEKLCEENLNRRE
jgi:hypothetical protein